MAIHELTSGVLFGVSAGSGQSATRKFSCDTQAEAIQTCKDLSGWPFPVGGFEAAWPSSITVHPFNESMAGTSTNPAAGATPAVCQGIPTYTKYLVVAQYQTLHNCLPENGSAPYPTNFPTWPLYIDIPYTTPGTTISLRVRNSGQFLTMSAQAGFVATEGGDYICSLSQRTGLVQLIPIREFHITLDRLTNSQVPNFQQYEGYVNESSFLGCPSETLLFETGEIDHSFVADYDNPCRFRISCCLRQRLIVPRAGHNANKPMGWNHEYNHMVPPASTGPAGAQGPGWYRVKMKDLSDRYPTKDFTNIFNGG